MTKISTHRFNKILAVLDDKNQFDFDSFTQAVLLTKLGITQEILDNIVDFLVFDLGITSDAELTHLPQVTLREIVTSMNQILQFHH